MANSAFDHSAAITLPSSSTNTALVRWSGTGGNTLTDSTILVGATTMGLAADTDLLTFSNGTLTIGGTLAATTLTGAGSGITSLNASNLGSGTIPDARFPATLPAISGANLTNLPAAGATLSGSTDNTVVTVTGSNAMVGEANLTYDGAELNVGSTGAKLVLDQSTGGAYLLELRSTGAVAHGISGYNTATYGQFMKKHATSGMLQIWGFSDADANQAIGLSLVGVSGIAADTTKTTSAIGIVEILAGIKNGTAIADPGSNGNILVIRDAASGSAKMIVYQEGDVRVNEGSAMPSVTKGAAKAWVQVPANGSMTTSSANSYNVASVTDNTTGDRSVVVDVDFTNTTYCALSSAGDYANLSLRTADYAVGSWNFKVYDGSTLIDKLCASAAFGSH